MLKAINLIKKHAIFGFVFTIAKATVYFLPLLLADVLSKSDFGVLEYALAGLGMIVNTLINLGVPGAYPYFVLREKKEHLKPAFKCHPIILLIPFIINQILFLGFDLNINFYLAFNVSFIIANQVFYSTQLKSHERSTLAVIFDSGIYIVLLACYVLSFMNLITINIIIINQFVVVYGLLYAIYGVHQFIRARASLSFDHYKTILRFSIHLLISTFLIFLITTSGRIIVEFFFDFETVGIYAFYFRLAAIVVMIHQVVNIAFFKKIYTFDPKILDAYYYKFFIFIFSLSILIYFVSPYILTHLSTYFNDTYVEYKSVYFLLSAQMVMWIATALNSNIIDRENLASKNNARFILLLILSIIVLYALRSFMSLDLLTFSLYSIIFVACLVQYFSLIKKQIHFSRSAVTLICTYVLTTGFYFLVLK